MPPVRSVHLAKAADARAVRDTAARTSIASASGNSTRSAEIRQQRDARLKTRRVPAKIVSARWRHGAIGCQRQSLVIHRRSGWIAGPRRSVTASPLQTGYGLCLKRREPVALLRFPCRGVAQLVEYRSPKPVVAGSSPAAPASKINNLNCDRTGWDG